MGRSYIPEELVLFADEAHHAGEGTFPEIGARLNVNPDALRQRVLRRHKRNGPCAFEGGSAEEERSWRRNKSWHFWNDGPVADSRKMPAITRLVERFPGISYAVSKKPDLKVLAVSETTKTVYGADPTGSSVWDGMVQIHGRIYNLEHYSHKGICAAKGVLTTAYSFRRVEFERVTELVGRYVAFVKNHPKLRRLWDSLEPDLDAIGTTYDKVLTHWEEGNSNLLRFKSWWGYLPRLGIYLVQYHPVSDGFTEDAIADLVYELCPELDSP